MRAELLVCLLALLLTLLVLQSSVRLNTSMMLSIFFLVFLGGSQGYLPQYYLAFFVSFLWSLIILVRSAGLNNTGVALKTAIPTVLIFFSGLTVLTTNNLYILVFGFESMMLSSLFLLKLLAKSERSTEAVVEMFVWGVVGSLLLIGSLIVKAFDQGGTLSLTCATLAALGFAIKVPLWPFTSWLLKAHVEASTEFSIFLSGFLVKFGTIALVSLSKTISLGLGVSLLWPLSVVGILDACVKLLAQVDLKRVVALTTVIETNWLMFCLSSQNTILEEIASLLIIVHCFTTTVEFYLVEFLYKRYGTRNYLRISNVYNLYPNLNKALLLSLAIVIGLPGTSIFTLKFIFFTQLLSLPLSLLVFFLIVFMFLLPICFVRIFLIIRGGYQFSPTTTILDLSSSELSALLIPLFVATLLSPVLFFLL